MLCATPISYVAKSAGEWKKRTLDHPPKSPDIKKNLLFPEAPKKAFKQESKNRIMQRLSALDFAAPNFFVADEQYLLGKDGDLKLIDPMGILPVYT